MFQIVQGQHIQYAHDAAGNRTHRIYIVPRLANPDIKDSSITQSGIYVFPNPAKNSVTVFINDLSTGEEVDVIISNNDGKIIVEKAQHTIQGSFDLKEIKPGNYYITVRRKDVAKSFKLVKIE
jgi:hypothetical protein